MDRLPKVQFELVMCGEGCSASMHKTQLESANYLLPRCSKALVKKMHVSSSLCPKQRSKELMASLVHSCYL